MIRAACGLLVSLCCTAAWGQYPIYPAYAQAAAMGYQVGFSQPVYQQPPSGMASPYGYGGNGYGGYGIGGYGYGPYGMGGYGFGGYGFVRQGYYPPNPFGNMNWLPPNIPSPYYVTPRGPQYLEQVRRRDQTTYSELLLQHNMRP